MKTFVNNLFAGVGKAPGMKRPCGTLIAVIAVAILGSAQAASEFEAASIKPSRPLDPAGIRTGQDHVGARIDPAIADYRMVSILELISVAYNVRAYQIDGPDWLKSTEFDITAKLPAGSSVDQIPGMMQTLLAKRFGLVVRREARELAAYALLEGTGGLKLAPRPDSYRPEATNAIIAMDISKLAGLITQSFDRPVVDQTGLAGEFLVPEREIRTAMVKRLMQQQARPMPNLESNPMMRGPDLDELITKYGLKLEKKKLSLPFVVVEHVERTPSPN